MHAKIKNILIGDDINDIYITAKEMINLFNFEYVSFKFNNVKIRVYKDNTLDEIYKYYHQRLK